MYVNLVSETGTESRIGHPLLNQGLNNDRHALKRIYYILETKYKGCQIQVSKTVVKSYTQMVVFRRKKKTYV